MSALDQLLAMMALWAAVLLNAILSIYLWSRKQAPGARSFAIVCGTMALFSWGLGLRLQVADIDLHKAILKASYFPIVLLPATFLFFCLDYTGRRDWLTWRRIAALTAFPLGIAVTSIFNWNGLVRQGEHMERMGTFHMLQY